MYSGTYLNLSLNSIGSFCCITISSTSLFFLFLLSSSISFIVYKLSVFLLLSPKSLIFISCVELRSGDDISISLSSDSVKSSDFLYSGFFIDSIKCPLLIPPTTEWFFDNVLPLFFDIDTDWYFCELSIERDFFFCNSPGASISSSFFLFSTPTMLQLCRIVNVFTTGWYLSVILISYFLLW